MANRKLRELDCFRLVRTFILPNMCICVGAIGVVHEVYSDTEPTAYLAEFCSKNGQLIALCEVTQDYIDGPI